MPFNDVSIHFLTWDKDHYNPIFAVPLRKGNTDQTQWLLVPKSGQVTIKIVNNGEDRIIFKMSKPNQTNTVVQPYSSVQVELNWDGNIASDLSRLLSGNAQYADIIFCASNEDGEKLHRYLYYCSKDWLRLKGIL